MILVALTGGIGSGKSTVSAILASRGAVIVDADAIVRELQQAGTPLLARLAERFGAGIIRADGPPWWQVSFAVADCDATVAEAETLGGSIDAPPEDVPDVGRFAVLVDPHGGRFGVLASEWAG